jgi:hypothetical protein
LHHRDAGVRVSGRIGGKSWVKIGVVIVRFRVKVKVDCFSILCK